MVRRLGLVTSGNRNIGRTNKQAADVRAKAMASTIRALQARDLVSFSAIAHELNEREIPTHGAANGTPAALADCCTAWKGWSILRELLSAPTRR